MGDTDFVCVCRMRSTLNALHLEFGKVPGTDLNKQSGNKVSNQHKLNTQLDGFNTSSFIQISFRWYIPKNPDPFIGNAKQKIGLKGLDPGFLPLDRFSPIDFL